ncbi:MAG: hypothetical protein A2029_09035 [Chloroflexi bacterium RBG_19FT_COMBO_47_9]|nr:MAG: hypothetical protein A2029_09035 [Chloroflexi bacterium RBG_19FT_COMBO_47_9]
MPSDPVECRSDYAYIGYPVAFFWRDKRLEVTQILSETRVSSGYSFRILNREVGFFELFYDLSTDVWTVQQS